MRFFQIGVPVEFDVLCPGCGKVDRMISGRVMEHLSTDGDGIQKASVNTGEKYKGTDNEVIYSVPLEKLRLKEEPIVTGKSKMIVIRIHVNDVLSIHPDWTEKQADEYVSRLGDKFRMVAEGWDILMIPIMDC